jgi:amino acid transporter
MLLVTVQALGELAVLFPVNGAFFTYVVRFIDPSLYAVPLLIPNSS